jgi:serpin B
VPTMSQQGRFGYARHQGFTAVTMPYSDSRVQLLILLPDKVDGLAELEKQVTPESLAACGTAVPQEVILHLPKFKLEPPSLPLSVALQSLGMRSAFDLPPGSANFERMSPGKGDGPLCVSEVFHKTFLALDEQGTEAAAATAVLETTFGVSPIVLTPPIEVRVDHPFLFAIQHRPSGACLFIGRLTEPR